MLNTQKYPQNRFFRRIAAVAAATLVLACVATAVSAQATQPVRGGTMTIINGSDIKSWDPAITSGTFPGGPMDALDAVYGFTVYINAEGVVTGGMAQGLTSSDAVTWTLKLRPGMKFTDGNPYD